MNVFVLAVLFNEVSFYFLRTHFFQSFQLVVDYLLSIKIEISIMKVQGAKLIWCLEHVRHFGVINFIPKEDTIEVAHQIVFGVHSIPSLLAVVVKSQVLDIEELVAVIGHVDCLEHIACVGAFCFYQCFFEVALLV